MASKCFLPRGSRQAVTKPLVRPFKTAKLALNPNMAQSPAIGAQASRLARDHLLGSSLSSPRMPKLLYGTAWKGDRTADLVYAALRAGFRGVDTAAQPKHYDERAVGEGVRRAVGEGLVQREHLFVRYSPARCRRRRGAG